MKCKRANSFSSISDHPRKRLSEISDPFLEIHYLMEDSVDLRAKLLNNDCLYNTPTFFCLPSITCVSKANSNSLFGNERNPNIFIDELCFHNFHVWILNAHYSKFCSTRYTTLQIDLVCILGCFIFRCFFIPT